MRFMMLVKANRDSGEGEIEIRQVFEASDFPAEIFPPEFREREEEMRKELQEKGRKP